MKIPELVSPAGNMLSLKAAIANGADAVYLGFKKFGARYYAGNFTKKEFREAVKYAHEKNAKVYVTINTLLKDNEFKELRRLLKIAVKENADAVIVQDLGVLKYIKENFPELRVHASTQMNVHSLHGIKFLEKYGVKRAVLARELSIDEIKEIRRKSRIELEVFVHRALCFSYSGNCLLSSLIGGRSANRGRCAQACRRRYKLFENKEHVFSGYLLSMKDLCAAEILDMVINAGADALKIEGRMKKPEYVAVVTKIYREFLDRAAKGSFYIKEEELYELRKIFNRDFTHAYLLGSRKNMLNPYFCDNAGVEIGMVTGKNKNRIKIKLSEELNKGDGIEIMISKGRSIGMEVNFSARAGKVVELAMKERDAAKVKLGSIVFKTRDIELIRKARKSYAS